MAGSNGRFLHLLKSKIHKARVTGADLHYEGSIAIDPALCDSARLHEFERVDIYNISTGSRFTTYVIYGKKGEISLNGAAARLVQVGDEIIIASYTMLPESDVRSHKPVVVLLDAKNQIQELKN